MGMKILLKKRILAFALSAAMIFSGVPVGVLAEENATEQTQEAAAVEFNCGAQAEMVDNGQGGKAVRIKTSWVDGGGNGAGLTSSAAFKDANIFKKEAFTLFADVYRDINGGGGNKYSASKVAFSVGNSDNYFNVRLTSKTEDSSVTTGEKSGLTYKKQGEGNAKSADSIEGVTAKVNAFSSFVVTYQETDGTGKVTVYIDGKKLLNTVDVGFALSSLTNISANIGGGFGTGYMENGIYDNIRIIDRAVSDEEVQPVNRYQSYSSFSGTASSYGGHFTSGNIAVSEWMDTNGEFIQAHGGQVQWLDTLDLDEDGDAEGGWIWYGEDKSRNGRPIDGIHCYTSPDLYNWTDRGMALYTHDVLPDKLNAAGTGVESNVEGLTQLKNWAKLEAPTAEVSQEDIDMARNFVRAYQLSDGTYDEENLERAYKYLYSGYCIAERPKMLYNETTGKYVLVYHVDGPSDENILTFLNGGDLLSRYTRASMGFAVSDTPYGPFKLINVQRMNYVDGYYDSSKGMARDMNVFVDDTDINNDGVKDAYAIYSSEGNKYMYISLLNSEYTAPVAGGNKGTITFGNGSVIQGPSEAGNQEKMTLDDGTEIQAFASRVLGSATEREAPAIFKFHGYYYMITSGTSGWAANTAQYFRAKNIFGPWTDLGDPCEGGSNTTFISQPTAVIPVDAKNGKFIYMGDRWNYSSNTDSAHWDSGYVWLPITVSRDYSITIENKADWDLSYFDNIDIWDYIEIDSEIPAVISSVEDLPDIIDVSINEVSFKDTAVEWTLESDEYFEEIDITGILTEQENRTISVNVTVVPENLLYFVDAGTEDKTDRTLYNQLVETCSELKNISASDQAYSAENGWGYVGDNTVQRSSDGTIYETLRYVNNSTNRTLTYQFDGLEEGCYTLYLGVYDPTSWYKDGMRQAAVTVKQNNVTLQTEDITCGGKGIGFYTAFEKFALEGDGSLQLTLTPKKSGEGSDMQLSWIAIARHIVYYTVTFKDGDDVLGEVEVESGMAAAAPSVQVKEGYIFKGWDKKFDNVTGDLIVNALWEEKKEGVEYYKVTFKDGDDVLGEVEVESGTAAAAPSVQVKEGYIFKGWDAEFDNVTKDLIVTAQWAKAYTVVFMNGEEEIDRQIVETGSSATAPTSPVKTGYTFKGWDKEFSSVTSDITVNAVWEKTTYYTVTFKDEDTVLKTEQVESGKAATAPTSPMKTGYTFKGWDTEFDNVTEDLTVNAVWEEVEPETTYYTVTFKNGDAVLKTEQVESGKAATAPASPTKTGYIFKDWDKAFTNVTSDLIVTAIWEKEADEAGNGGTGTDVKDEAGNGGTGTDAKDETGNGGTGTAVKDETGNSGTGTDAPKTIAAKKVTLNTKKLYLVKGKSAALKALITPSNSTDKLTWSSSKSSVASVSNGKIKAKKTGSATITVKAGGKKATCKVYVVKKAKKSRSIKLNKKKASIKAGNWILLTSTLKPSSSTDTVKWKSSNSKVASVSNGFVTAKKKGKATITATANGKKATCTITVK